MDVFTAIQKVGAYIETGCVQHKTYYSGICPVCLSMRREAREGLAELARTIDLMANDTTAADLAQEIEFLKAELSGDPYVTLVHTGACHGRCGEEYANFNCPECPNSRRAW